MNHKDRMPAAYRSAIQTIKDHSTAIASEIESTSDSDAHVGGYLVLIELSESLKKIEYLLLEAYDRERRKHND